MLIRCPQCNHDNQLGAIFCRSCGAKLDVESIRPKVIDQRMSDWNFFGLIRRFLGLGILLGLTYVIVMMFMPSPDFAVALSEDEQEVAKTKFDELLRRIDGGFGRDTYAFSANEVTFLYNDKFLATAKSEGGGTYQFKSLAFMIDAQEYTHLRLVTSLGTSIPATFEIKGFIPGESLSLTVTKAQMGKMKMPQMAHGKIIEKFLPATAGTEVQRILGATSRLEVKDGNYVLTLK